MTHRTAACLVLVLLTVACGGGVTQLRLPYERATVTPDDQIVVEFVRGPCATVKEVTAQLQGPETVVVTVLAEMGASECPATAIPETRTIDVPEGAGSTFDIVDGARDGSEDTPPSPK